MRGTKHQSYAAVVVAACVLVAGCGESPDNIKLIQLQAMSVCADRAFEQLGVKNGDDEKIVEKVDSSEPDFRLASTGQFVAKLPRLVLKDTARTIEVTCTGDFNRRTITSLQFDGMIRRPIKAVDWTF